MRVYKIVLMLTLVITIISGCTEIKINLPDKEQEKIKQTPSVGPMVISETVITQIDSTTDTSTTMDNPPHIYHIGIGSPNINCDVCHGFPPNTNKPSGKLDSYGVCGNCHETIRKSVCGG